MIGPHAAGRVHAAYGGAHACVAVVSSASAFAWQACWCDHGWRTSRLTRFDRRRIAMKKSVPAASPDAYVAALDGWRKTLVTALRKATRAAGTLDEQIKWGHLVYSSNGPVLLIRAEDARVLFGFWRGQRLREIDARLKPGGKYEMATMALVEGDKVDATLARRLVEAAIELNRTLGDPRG